MDPHALSGRVCDVALGRLAASGYAMTTLADVARAAGVPEEDLRTHFGDLEGLMAELVSPLVASLRGLAMAAHGVDGARAHAMRELLLRYYDTLADHRALALVALDDPTAGDSGAVLRVRAAVLAVQAELAGAGADLDHIVRTASAMGAVHDAVRSRSGLTVRDAVNAGVALLGREKAGR